MKAADIASLLLVGAFWGCTNPLLRKGSEAVDQSNKQQENNHLASPTSASSSRLTITSTLKKFINVRVWLPYAINQCGSVVFYTLLSSEDLTLAVPICNGLALVFSCVTSYLLGERVDQPARAILGAACVVMGVAWCMMDDDTNESGGGEEEVQQ